MTHNDDTTKIEIGETTQVEALPSDTSGMTPTPTSQPRKFNLHKTIVTANIIIGVFAAVLWSAVGIRWIDSNRAVAATPETTTSTTSTSTTAPSTTTTTQAPVTTQPKSTKSTTTTPPTTVAQTTDTTTPGMPAEPTEQQKNIPGPKTTVPEDDEIGRQPWSVPPKSKNKCEQFVYPDGSSKNTRVGTNGKVNC